MYFNYLSLIQTKKPKVFYNAWVKLIPPAPFHLFCLWHEDRTWWKNFIKNIGREKAAETYKLFRTLLEEGDQAEFVRMLRQ